MGVGAPQAALRNEESLVTSTLPRGELPAERTLAGPPTKEEMQHRYFCWLVVLLSCSALYALLPLWTPLVLASWTAILTAPFVARAEAGHRRQRAAAIATAAAVLIVVPIALVTVTLSRALIDFASNVARAPDQMAALRSALASEPGRPMHWDLKGAIAALRSYGQGAFETLNVVAGVTVEAILGVTIFVLATYRFLLSGKLLYVWLLDHLPLPRGHLHRLANAYVETGRGLFLGIGATALAQGVAAGIGYFALGVPKPAILMLLTAMAAIIPSVGTALVWVPVSIGLFIANRPGAGVIMIVIGLTVSTVDNFLRPVLARRGDLQLPEFAVFLAMLGGLAAFGGWGVILGPLALRLAVEGLLITAHAPPHD